MNVDMVIGSRFIEKEGFQSSQLRRVGIVFFSKLITIAYRYKNYRPNIRTSHDVDSNVMALFATDYPRDYPEPESVVAVLRRKMKVEEIPVIHERKDRWSIFYFYEEVSVLYD